MRILGVVGARPNFVKIDPVLRALDREPDLFSTHLVHTGQHYDQHMSQVFFDELGIRHPDTNLGVGSGTHAGQTAAIMVGIEQILLQAPYDLVMVVGDVNSTMAATLAAAKLGVAVAHVEAGLRSFDRSMPEETNRVVTDALAGYLLTPSIDGNENLLNEGIPAERIFCVGNVMIDTLLRCRDLAERSVVFGALGIERGRYALLTLHRPCNVDRPESFQNILAAMEHIQQRIRIVFPIHPRTAAQLDQHGLRERIDAMPNLQVVPPQSYLDFLSLQAHAKFVLTDSGGVQEETTVLGVPCLTLRENTERPVTLTQGTNQLVGHETRKIIEKADGLLDGPVSPGKIPELWDGAAAERVVEVLRRAA